MNQRVKQPPQAGASTLVRTCRWSSESQWHSSRCVSAYKRWQHWYCVEHTCHWNTPNQKHNFPQRAAHRRCRDRSSGRRYGLSSENPLHNYRFFPAHIEHELANRKKSRQWTKGLQESISFQMEESDQINT